MNVYILTYSPATFCIFEVNSNIFFGARLLSYFLYKSYSGLYFYHNRLKKRFFYVSLQLEKEGIQTKWFGNCLDICP